MIIGGHPDWNPLRSPLEILFWWTWPTWSKQKPTVIAQYYTILSLYCFIKLHCLLWLNMSVILNFESQLVFPVEKFLLAYSVLLLRTVNLTQVLTFEWYCRQWAIVKGATFLPSGVWCRMEIGWGQLVIFSGFGAAALCFFNCFENVGWITVK